MEFRIFFQEFQHEGICREVAFLRDLPEHVVILLPVEVFAPVADICDTEIPEPVGLVYLEVEANVGSHTRRVRSGVSAGRVSARPLPGVPRSAGQVRARLRSAAAMRERLRAGARGRSRPSLPYPRTL